MKIISVCSGKGGVGKTSVAVNLAAALEKLNKRVALIDCNLTTAHLGVMFGLYSTNKTLNGVLRGELKLEDAVHRHVSGLHIVPASLELRDLSNVSGENLKDSIKDSFKHYDFVLLDSAPGIGKEALISLKACDEAVFVANPYIPSVVDVLKTKNLSRKIGFYSAGIVVNRARGSEYELSKEDIYNFTEMHVLGTIPEDESILRAVNEREIPFIKYPKSQSATAFFELAHKIAGFPYYGR